MKLCLLIVLSIQLVFSSLATATLRGLWEDNKDEDKNHRIVGGKPAAIGAYPSYAIPMGGGCGASLVHEDILVSAAHCARVFMGREICLGGNKLSGEDAKEIIMADTERIHPQYDGDTNDNDVLLIKLNQPSSAAPLECNTESAVPADQDTVRTIGFGVLSEYGPESENLMEVDVNVVSSAVCKAASEWEVFDDTMICASSPGKDSCYGDSGGPLLSMDGKLVGIVSWGTGLCAEEGKPGVYTRISACADDFIRTGICELSSNPPADCPLQPLPWCANGDDLLVQMNLKTDFWGHEISWQVVRQTDGSVVMQGDGMEDSKTDMCLLPDECYTFTIYDSFGDGLMSAGEYNFSVDWEVLASGSDFGYSESVSFGGGCV